MPPRSAWIAAAACGLVLAALLWGLRLLSTQLTLHHLQQQSSHRLDALQHGRPLWQWTLGRPDDLIAGRAFGAARLAASADGVRMTSIDGSAYEVGLRLAQPIDLAHWPLLRLQGHSEQDGALGLIYQGQGPRCSAADAAAVPNGRLALVIDLRRLAWRTPAGRPCPPPAVVRMLRLRPRWPAGGRWTLTHVAAWTAPGAPVSPTGPWTGLPGAPTGLALWRPAGGIDAAAPILRVPPRQSAAHLLAWRDAALARWPGALLQAGDRPLRAIAAPAPSPSPWAWAVSALYLAALLGLGTVRWDRAGGWRGTLELAGVLAGPLWLLAGLRLGTPQAMPAAIAFAGALVHAAQSGWRRGRRDWRWFGGGRTAWAAFLPVPVAAGLAWALGPGWQLPAAHAVIVYVLWAGLQQWLLLVAVLGRVQRLTASPLVAVLATATVFALFHTPNGTLMQLCLLGEAWWAATFLRHRAIAPVALAHAAAALVIQAGLAGGPVLRSLEVGGGFFL